MVNGILSRKRSKLESRIRVNKLNSINLYIWDNVTLSDSMKVFLVDTIETMEFSKMPTEERIEDIVDMLNKTEKVLEENIKGNQCKGLDEHDYLLSVNANTWNLNRYLRILLIIFVNNRLNRDAFNHQSLYYSLAIADVNI